MTPDEDIHRLAGLEGHPFQAMTFPSYRSLLMSLHLPDVVAIGAFHDRQPSGLAIACVHSDTSAEILSLFVTPAQRNQHLGHRLLRAVDEELVRQGCREATITYNQNGRCTPQLERVLERCQWPKARPRSLICKAKPNILNADWMEKVRVPRGGEIFLWCDLRADERDSIYQRQRADPWVPEDLLPNRHEQGMELLNSVGLRVGGEVVGWVITHQIVRNVYRYTCSFVKTELQRRLAIVPLYREAISRQVQKEGQDTIGIWTVPVRHHQMVAFVEHRMAPHLHSLDYSLAATKRYTQ